MKVVQINVTCGQGSTGKICLAISELLNNKGTENYIIYSQGKTTYSKAIKINDKFYYKLQALKSRICGNFGFNSKNATKKIITILEKTNPDVIHLHNLHGHNVNLQMLFCYLKKHSNIKIIWTFHDCWAFTGYCSYFDLVKCDKWKEFCYECLQKKGTTWFVDNSSKMYALKKRLFTGVENMMIVTPSEWLAGLVKQSFLKDYPVKVINNGINLSVFKPTESDFREKYGISADKKILLGVAFGWGVRKGLDVFIELYNRLDMEKYQIVLVGTDKKTDKQLPKGIISIHRTQNQTELAEIYTAADLFVNPTREDNYPTVNMEAIACGTPVLTFRTGGSPEMVTGKTGSVVDCDDIDSLEREIKRICETASFAKEDCIEQAKKFDENERFLEYIVKVYGYDRS